jgi:hypothetical protein
MLPLLGTLSVSIALAQDNLTLSGRVVTKAASKSIPRFAIKLYPPLKSNKPILLTTTNESGEFKLEGLSADSYLLEVHLGKDLVHQQIIKVDGQNSNRLTIDLSGSAKPSPQPYRKARGRGKE